MKTTNTGKATTCPRDFLRIGTFFEGVMHEHFGSRSPEMPRGPQPAHRKGNKARSIPLRWIPVEDTENSINLLVRDLQQCRDIDFALHRMNKVRGDLNQPLHKGRPS